MTNLTSNIFTQAVRFISKGRNMVLIPKKDVMEENPIEETDTLTSVFCFGKHKVKGNEHDYKNAKEMLTDTCEMFDIDSTGLTNNMMIKALAREAVITPVFDNENGITLEKNGKTIGYAVLFREDMADLMDEEDDWTEIAQEIIYEDVHDLNSYLMGDTYRYELHEEEGDGSLKLKEILWGYFGKNIFANGLLFDCAELRNAVVQGLCEVYPQ